MLPANELSSEIQSSKKQIELFEKYDKQIKEKIESGIVDPLKVFLHLFNQYCDKGDFRTPVLHDSRNHIDFLKDVNISTMQQMLAHLNSYWGRVEIAPETEFYALCYMFFYYYGTPGFTYEHLQKLSNVIQDQIAIENKNANKVITLFKKISVLTAPQDSMSKQSQKLYAQNNNLLPAGHLSEIFSVLALNDVKSDALGDLTNANGVLNNRDNFNLDITNVRKVCEAYSALMIKYAHNHKELLTIFCNNFTSDNKDFIGKFHKLINIYTILCSYNNDLREILIKKLIDGLDNENIIYSLSCVRALCYCTIPLHMQSSVIEKIFTLLDNGNLKQLLNIFICAEFDIKFRHMIINKLLNRLDNCNPLKYEYEVILNALVQIDLTSYPAEKLVKILLSVSPHPHVFQIFSKINIPEQYQYEIMQSLINNLKDTRYLPIYFNRFLEIFPRLTASQKLYWRGQIFKLAAVEASGMTVDQCLARATPSRPAHLLVDIGFRGLYALIRYEYPVLALNDAQPYNDLQKNIEIDRIKQRLLNAISCNNANEVRELINSIENQFTPLIDYAFAIAISHGNMIIINIILEKNPSGNYILNGKTLLQLIPKKSVHQDFNIAQIIQILVSRSADGNYRDPLYSACTERNYILGVALLRHYTNLKIMDGLGALLEFDKLNEFDLGITYPPGLNSIYDMIKLFFDYHYRDNKFSEEIIPLLIIYLSYFREKSYFTGDRFLSKDEDYNLIEILYHLLDKGVWDYKLCELVILHNWPDILRRLIRNIPNEHRCQILNDLLSKCSEVNRLEIAMVLIEAGADITLLDLKLIVVRAFLTNEFINKVCRREMREQSISLILSKVNEHFDKINSDNVDNMILLFRELPDGVNTIDQDGMTLLHYVCNKFESDNSESDRQINNLLRAGADLFIRDKKGYIPEEYIYSERLLEGSGMIRMEQASKKLRDFRKLVAKNYQAQLLTKKMHAFHLSKQTGDTVSPLAKLPSELMSIAFQRVVHPHSIERIEQQVNQKMKKTSETVAALLIKRREIEARANQCKLAVELNDDSNQTPEKQNISTDTDIDFVDAIWKLNK